MKIIDNKNNFEKKIISHSFSSEIRKYGQKFSHIANETKEAASEIDYDGSSTSRDIDSEVYNKTVMPFKEAEDAAVNLASKGIKTTMKREKDKVPGRETPQIKSRQNRIKSNRKAAERRPSRSAKDIILKTNSGKNFTPKSSATLVKNVSATSNISTPVNFTVKTVRVQRSGAAIAKTSGSLFPYLAGIAIFMVALTWNDVNLNDKYPSIRVNKILQRVDKDTLVTLQKRDIYKIYPNQKENAKSVIVAKKPKTDSSVRTIYLPNTVASMLEDRYKAYLNEKIYYNKEYKDFNLVFCGADGYPVEPHRLRKMFQAFIEDNNLPAVCFHSLRHMSITYKLKLTNGNIKAVQGDSGHSKADMITDIDSHILDEDRICNASLIEKAFYSKDKYDKIGTNTNLENNISANRAEEINELIIKLSRLISG